MSHAAANTTRRPVVHACFPLGAFAMLVQEFDAGAVPEPNEPVYRVAAAAAAAAVNIHPLARTFEGLVPVSLDAPLPRPKRKGKQVTKNGERVN